MHLGTLFLSIPPRLRPSYFSKDFRKAERATQFIGQGSRRSSTALYAQYLAPVANTGRYSPDDIVFVSAEGDRFGRFDPIGYERPRGAYTNLDLAAAAGSSFLVDGPADRERPHNVGERQIAAYLVRLGCREVAPGVFRPTKR